MQNKLNSYMGFENRYPINKDLVVYASARVYPDVIHPPTDRFTLQTKTGWAGIEIPKYITKSKLSGKIDAYFLLKEESTDTLEDMTVDDAVRIFLKEVKKRC
jgi:actin-related protein